MSQYSCYRARAPVVAGNRSIFHVDTCWSTAFPSGETFERAQSTRPEPTHDRRQERCDASGWSLRGSTGPAVDMIALIGGRFACSDGPVTHHQVRWMQLGANCVDEIQCLESHVQQDYGAKRIRSKTRMALYFTEHSSGQQLQLPRHVHRPEEGS